MEERPATSQFELRYPGFKHYICDGYEILIRDDDEEEVDIDKLNCSDGGYHVKKGRVRCIR
jgi:hypothetical protein